MAEMEAVVIAQCSLDVQDIFETLHAVDGEADEYEKTVRALDLYFQPRMNIPYERHVLRQFYQEAFESVVQFVTRLRQQADFCDFGDQRDDNIRDQLIEKCKSVALRKQLLEKRDITLSEDRQFYQEAFESVVQFVTRLRQQADFCDFGDQRDDNISDQLIEKCKSVALRKQLLEKRDITLSEDRQFYQE